METRFCNCCNLNKPIKDFPISKGKPREKCKVCLKEYMNNHYKKNKKSYIDYTKKRQDELIKWFHNLKSSLFCIKCKENHPSVLDFHHRDPKEKDFNVGDALYYYKNKNKILKEIEKCDVLCSNCHRKLHWDEREKSLEKNLEN